MPTTSTLAVAAWSQGVAGDCERSEALDTSASAVCLAIGPDRLEEGPWLLGQTSAIRNIARQIERAAQVECPVLLVGETGTGKELLAHLLHAAGPRAAKPMVPVNCAASTATLAESQLFGHEKGAFTGADASALGVFRAAEAGIVLLDEIGEMPLELQPKLLRVLQEREVTPVGATRSIAFDVQVIAATNRDLDADVASGRFREDLFYRLNMVELHVPALARGRKTFPTSSNSSRGSSPTKYERLRWWPNAGALNSFASSPGPAISANYRK